ncbi:hypothetical protein [Reyranella sp. CPCC 100927]|uniref:hypothetical protein n=1 Tax=Reyranella sp. CPCC 100927 TaxID=2599616 RepID=UPI0011B69B0E|nr:hypothetical protein [Reyranella sp. CPCC 100927]TWT05932.1 hypothetical protein FQU96_23025 [Reyranella sp. CPCC 100927]
MERRVLETIRDAADPFVAQAEDCLKRLRMDRRTFVKIVGDLQKRHLIEIDEDTGAIRLTEAGDKVLLQQGAIGTDM